METSADVPLPPQRGSGGAATGEKNLPKSAPELVIFTRTFDFLAWLLPHTNHFPRAHRHSVTKRLLDAALDLRECLEEANVRRGPARQERLARADEALAKIRLYLRLATKFQWQTPTNTTTPSKCWRRSAACWAAGRRPEAGRFG